MKLAHPISGEETEVTEVRPHPQFEGKTVVQSADDGFQWTNPLPTGEELNKLYSEDYNDAYGRDVSKGAKIPNFVSRRAVAQMSFIEKHAAVEELDALKNVAEAGAGWGTLSLAFQERFSNASVVAYELDVAGVDSMKDRGLDARFGTLEGDGDLAPESFDLVASSHVIEHLREPFEAIKAWHSLLRPGGLMFSEIPLENPVPNWWGKNADKPYWVGHLYYFKPQHFKAMLDRIGFDVISATPHDHTVSPGYVMPGSTELYDVDVVDPALDVEVSTAEFPKVLRVLARKRA